MPTITVDKADLWEKIGQKFSFDDFEKLCFDYGLELDEDTTSELTSTAKTGLPSERPQMKIEVPANRCDLLCVEGIARALRTFLQISESPRYQLAYPPDKESLLTVTCTPEVQRVRPFFECALLRNVKFSPRSYASFIDLQDKLHQNIGRKRQMVAIGTHDFDTLKPPFRYEARSPRDIKFAPLNKDKIYTAEELMTIYESDKHLSKYLHIIRDSPVYPVIYDSAGQVLSMPPIINSNHSKITLETRNVFIDVTATDKTKLDIVLNTVATMFSEYCEEPFSIEPVKIILADGQAHISPDLSGRVTTARTSYINSCTGLSLTSSEVSKCLQRMSLHSSPSPSNPNEVVVEVPPTRPDILHECDIMEDVAIAYGFNNLPHAFPATPTVAQPLSVSKLSDVIRREWAMAGWVEVLPLILSSHAENFEFLNQQDDGNTAVKIANPKTLEFQVVRTTLLPGLLKAVRENRSHSLPMKIFETSDVAFKDTSRERQSRNARHAAAVYCNKVASFEVVHGLLNRAMKILEIPRISNQDRESGTGYYIVGKEDATYFPGRGAKIIYRPAPLLSDDEMLNTNPRIPVDIEVGKLGVLHPSVLAKFDITYPCSALEFTLEPFKKKMDKIWTNDD